MTIQDRAREVLAQASVIAEGPAMRWQAPTSHGKSEDAIPLGGSSIYDLIADRFRAASNPGELARAVAWAEQKLREIKTRPRDLTVDQTRYWAIVASQGRDYRDVAAAEGLSETQVWKMRRDAGYDPRKGHPKAA